jgi:hypothetical protein
MGFAVSARCCVVAMLGLIFIGATLALPAPEGPCKAQIDALRKGYG